MVQRDGALPGCHHRWGRCKREGEYMRIGKSHEVTRIDEVRVKMTG